MPKSRAGKPLSARELAIAKMAKDGQSRDQIATVLEISPETVKTHLHNIFEKLNISGAGAARELKLRAKELFA